MTTRRLWQIAGLAAAIAVAWLIVRAYRQPEFMIDMLTMVGLC